MNLDFIRQLNSKKILLIVGFLMICFLLAFGVYYLFFKTDSETQRFEELARLSGQLQTAGEGGDINLAGTGGGLPSAGDKEIGNESEIQYNSVANGGKTQALPVFENVVSGVGFLENKEINFYNLADNKFYYLPVNSDSPHVLSDNEFYEVSDVEWSDDGQKAIIFYPDGNKIYYDFTKDKQVTLNSNLVEPDFSSTGKVAFKNISENSDENWLVAVDPAGGETQLIEPLGENADFVQVNWSPNNKIAGTYYQPIGLNTSEVFFLDLAGENLKSLEVAGSNFEGIWTPDGRKIVYSVVNSSNRYNPTLWISDVGGETTGLHKFNLGVTTWAKKCAFASNSTLYCAVPRELPEGAGLYPELFSTTDDLIYKINLTTGFSELLAEPILNNQSFSIQQININIENKILYFVDSKTSKIYKINLP